MNGAFLHDVLGTDIKKYAAVKLLNVHVKHPANCANTLRFIVFSRGQAMANTIYSYEYDYLSIVGL